MFKSSWFTHTMSTFDSPIGYAKNPLLPSQQVISIKPQTLSNGILPYELLPFEIRCDVANRLSQYDCLNLLRTSKTVYASTVDRLYQSIVVDADFKRFDNEREYGWTRSPFACTYISSPYNLRRFLKVAPNQTVRQFECTSLPESLNIYEYGLHNDLLAFFKTLDHLTSLIWRGVGFDMQYVRNLPDKKLLRTLVLHTEEDLENNLVLSLVHLELSPASAHKLKRLELRDNLQVMSARVGNYDHSLMNPKCHELVSFGEREEQLEEENSVMLLLSESNLSQVQTSPLFSRQLLLQICNLPVHQLSTISLQSVLLSPSDAQRLMRSISFPGLSALILRGVSEYQKLPARGPNIAQLLEPSFLSLIAPHLTNLKHLVLDYREAYTSSVSAFLSELPEDLESLDLTLRFNDTAPPFEETPGFRFRNQGQTEPEFYDELGLALCTLKKLKKLSLEARREHFNYSSLTSSIDHLTSAPAGTTLYTEHLKKLTNLQTLRVNPGTQSVEVLSLVQELPALRKLDVFGSRAGGSPNLGLGMVHPTVYDEWFKVQHVATQYVFVNSSIRYIRINKCVFEVTNGSVNPRSGLEKWFDREVRV